MYSIAKPRIDQKTLKCLSSNCDFFGNSQFEHFCSKCYREKVLKERLAQGKQLSKVMWKWHLAHYVMLILASRSKLHKGVSHQQQQQHLQHAKQQNEGHHATSSSPSVSGDDKKSKKRNILEVFKKTTSLTSKDSFNLSRKHHKHVERVLEPVAIAHLEMLKVIYEMFNDLNLQSCLLSFSPSRYPTRLVETSRSSSSRSTNQLIRLMLAVHLSTAYRSLYKTATLASLTLWKPKSCRSRTLRRR